MYLGFDESFIFISKFNIKTRKQWNEFSKTLRPKNIPSCPQKVYKEWISWNHWLSNSDYKKKKQSNFLTFEECIKIISTYKIYGLVEWHEFSKTLRPKNIPSTPNLEFKSEWISWPHWLSSNCVHNKDKSKLIFYTFEECLSISKKLGIKSIKEWHVWSKNNIDDRVPSNPNKTYSESWKGWNYFLDNDSKNTKEIHNLFLSFDDARSYVRSLNLKKQEEWYDFCKIKPNNIPTNPHRTYKKEWIGFGDWIGSSTIATQNRQYISFDEARNYVRSLCLKRKCEWVELVESGKIPSSLPSTPHHVYKDNGWISYRDFLGFKIRSKGELKISNWLLDNNINYIHQHKFNECKSVRKLPFDFYLPDYNLCIEYDGKQHFEPIEWFGGENSLQSNRMRDLIKTEYCINNNVRLIRISYIDDIISKLENSIKLPSDPLTPHALEIL